MATYTPTGDAALAARLIARRRDQNEPLGTVLLEGPPGAGKTAWVDHVAQPGDTVVRYSCHEDTNDLVSRLRIGRVVGGNPDVWADGPLAAGFRASTTLGGDNIAVVLIDEIDKMPAAAEALMLDALQRWEVRREDGELVVADTTRVLVVLTSNGNRQLGEPLRRRCDRFAFERPDVDTVTGVVAAAVPSAPARTVRTVAAWADRIAEHVAADVAPSLPEVERTVRNLLGSEPCDRRRIVELGLGRDPADAERLLRAVLEDGWWRSRALR